MATKFNPTELTNKQFEELATAPGSRMQDDIYEWLKGKKGNAGNYAIDDEEDCPSIGGSGTSCSLSSKIRSRAKVLDMNVGLKHSKKSKRLLITIE